MKKLIVILLMLAMLCEICLSEAMGDSFSMYIRAKALMESGQYLQAAELFEALGDYNDSREQAAEARKRYSASQVLLTLPPEVPTFPDEPTPTPPPVITLPPMTLPPRPSVQAGAHVFFGTYEQDGNYRNGREPIEWLVLEIDGDEMIMISRYGLDVVPYNNTRKHTTWEDSSVRQWLNTTFIREAFDADQRSALRTQYVIAEPNHWHPDYSCGRSTYDEVFLLSVREFEQYMLGIDAEEEGLSKKKVRSIMDSLPASNPNHCQPTEYAEQQGARIKRGNCYWWLRSPGDQSSKAATVFHDGHYIEDHFWVNAKNACVRPAVRVNIAEAMANAA